MSFPTPALLVASPGPSFTRDGRDSTACPRSPGSGLRSGSSSGSVSGSVTDSAPVPDPVTALTRVAAVVRGGSWLRRGRGGRRGGVGSALGEEVRCDFLRRSEVGRGWVARVETHESCRCEPPRRARRQRGSARSRRGGRRRIPGSRGGRSSTGRSGPPRLAMVLRIFPGPLSLAIGKYGARHASTQCGGIIGGRALRARGQSHRVPRLSLRALVFPPIGKYGGRH